MGGLSQTVAKPPLPCQFSAREVPPSSAFFVRFQLSVLVETKKYNHRFSLDVQTLLTESPPLVPTKCHLGHRPSEVPTLVASYYDLPRRRPQGQAIAYAYRATCHPFQCREIPKPVTYPA